MTQFNPHSTFAETATEVPAAHAATITPADSDLDDVTRAVYVGGAGDLAVQMLGGEIVTFVAVPAGSLLPIRVKQIRSTNTTATSIVSLF
jgi:hypothetical protein